VNTEDLAAFRAAPLFFFVPDELPYAEVPDVVEIADHAHAIPGSIALIQMVQHGAGKAVAAEAVPDLGVHDLLAVFDSACDAGFGFEAVLPAATGALSLFLPANVRGVPYLPLELIDQVDMHCDATLTIIRITSILLTILI
jgi:hypothetical protein